MYCLRWSVPVKGVFKGGGRRRVSRGGPKGPGPPLEIEKQKKKKKVIRANMKLFHLYFATFLVENVFFSASF